MRATYANPDLTAVALHLDDRVVATTPDDPRLAGLPIDPYEEPATRIVSVLPVAFRRAARRITVPGQSISVMAALEAGAASDPDVADALEYAVVMKRADLIAAGMPAALAEAVLTLAATYEESGAIIEPIPPEAP